MKTRHFPHYDIFWCNGYDDVFNELSMMEMAMINYVPRENISAGEGMNTGDTGTDDSGFDFDMGF